VTRGEQSGIHEPRQVVIREQQAFAALWAEHVGFVTPPPPLPEVDFVTEQVVGIFVGMRSSSGYRVEITACRQAADRRIVEYVESQPPPGAITLAVMTSPFHLVKMPRSEDLIEFRATER
jgi:hypothetical protein